MCFAAERNGSAGRIWPTGRSLETPHIEYEEESWQHTPLSEFNTTVNGCDLTPPTKAPIVSKNTVTWRPVTGGRQHGTVLPQHSPKFFTRTLVIKMFKCLWHAPKISRKSAGEWNFVLLCYGRDKNRTGYHPGLVQLFRGIFLQGPWRTLFLGRLRWEIPQ